MQSQRHASKVFSLLLQHNDEYVLNILIWQVWYKASLNGLSYNQKLNLKFLHCLRQTKQQELFKPDAGAGQLEICHHVPGEGHAGQRSLVHLTRIRQVGCEMLWWLLKVFGFMKPGLVCPWYAYCSPLQL